jgi:fructose-bisphosphate aldolase class II
LKNIKDIMIKAREENILIPALNVPYPPMAGPMIRAVADAGSFALIEVARVEWEKFGAVSLETIYREYEKHADTGHVRLHLDHVPVIDEDGKKVDYRSIISEALELGYNSVMIDASRLDLAGNIAATREIVEMAHPRGVPVEAELGAVLGHEAGPIPPYEELFASGQGFTDLEEAIRFVRESGVDWLSVAVGSIHGAVSGAAASQKKVTARIHQDHLTAIDNALGVPLVLHGGSGIDLTHVREAVTHGISKMNIGTELRQLWETVLASDGEDVAADALYSRVGKILKDDLQIAGSAARLLG